MYVLQKKSTHFDLRVLKNFGLWLSVHFQCKKNHRRKIEKIRRNFWTISSLHVWFSMLKCPHIPKYILLTRRINKFWGQRFLNYIKSSCVIFCTKMSHYFHIVYYWHALKAFLTLFSKNWFYFFFLIFLTSICLILGAYSLYNDSSKSICG